MKTTMNGRVSQNANTKIKQKQYNTKQQIPIKLVYQVIYLSGTGAGDHYNLNSFQSNDQMRSKEKTQLMISYLYIATKVFRGGTKEFLLCIIVILSTINISPCSQLKDTLTCRIISNTFLASSGSIN
jgi:hypothetical protein